ncbi:MAG: DUF2612 domain-containing protein [Oxalobacter formigenes]|nr:DUF2612 domain-containing protein [Oxalobacter formigenes]
MIPIQYQNSPKLSQLVDFVYQHYDAQAVIDKFYEIVVNIDTAKGFGLDIWGRIVGVGRYLTVTPQNKNFGFNTPNNSFTPFNVAPFRNGEPVTDTYRLNDNAYRKLIFVKAMANIVRPNAPAINNILQYLFDGKRCYVLDLGNMAMRYVFAFYLQPYERAIIESEYFPRPAGVRVEILEIPEPNIFGFHEGGESCAPFNQGTFYNGR